MKSKFLSYALLLAVASTSWAQQALNNDSIVKMVKSGLADGVIVSMIQSQPGTYTINPDTMIALKQSGVSDAVLSAMAAKGAAPAAPAAGPATTAAAAASPYDDMDIGVYMKKKGDWLPVPIELVNWKTGGVLKSIASHGIVKEDVNGHLNGADSKTAVNTPLEFLIKTQDGVEATEYQLVHLHVNSNNREFRTKTGGVFHSSGGETRDNVEFQQERIAKHIYQITLPTTMTPGEYAFIAPGLTNSSASGSTGKAYTFHFVE
jgi:hypothetical protein